MFFCFVALRKESVDRNQNWIIYIYRQFDVALRKESVDRNITSGCLHALVFTVALRKESVDRNPPTCTIRQMLLTSLSARRAWIEIIMIRFLFRLPKSRSPQGERG